MIQALATAYATAEEPGLLYLVEAKLHEAEGHYYWDIVGNGPVREKELNKYKDTPRLAAVTLFRPVTLDDLKQLPETDEVKVLGMKILLQKEIAPWDGF